MKNFAAKLALVFALLGAGTTTYFAYNWMYAPAGLEESKNASASGIQTTDDQDSAKNNTVAEVVDVAEHFRGFSRWKIVRGVILYAVDEALE